MAVSEHAFIDADLFQQLSSLSLTVDEITNLEMLIDSVTDIFESFCSRKLKARDFSYLVSADQDYAIFDGTKGTIFRFPTYPVNSLTTLIIDDETISVATTYDDTDGYFLYNEKGELYYSYGFSFGYRQNVKLVWNGGYGSDHKSYKTLQHLTYLLSKKLWDDNSGDVNPEVISEKIGSYSYSKMKPEEMSKLFGLPIYVFNNLGRFKWVVMA